MKQNAAILLVFYALLSCHSQPSQQNLAPKPSPIIGGGCEGCELMYVGMPAHINETDTSAGWWESGQRLLVTGKVFQLDGKTPAPNVILYYWQTDSQGLYSSTPQTLHAAKQHGHIRGWVKSNQRGEYAIYTIRPAAYPKEAIPQHIHISIKEPGLANEYYIDDLVFDDDPLLLPALKKSKPENRGGNGILRVVVNRELHIAEHNIHLGLHIPHYPTRLNSPNRSGLEIGEDQPSFIPHHVYGPDAGTRTCPVCKYGRYHGILFFVGNNPDWNEIKDWLRFLEDESKARSTYLKAYLMMADHREQKIQEMLLAVGRELQLRNVALTLVPSYDDIESEVNLNRINPQEANTVIIYRHRKIVDKYVALKANPQNFEMIRNVLDQTTSPYFSLPEIRHD